MNFKVKKELAFIVNVKKLLLLLLVLLFIFPLLQLKVDVEKCFWVCACVYVSVCFSVRGSTINKTLTHTHTRARDSLSCPTVAAVRGSRRKSEKRVAKGLVKIPIKSREIVQKGVK